jgi:hypothetical protein
MAYDLSVYHLTIDSPGGPMYQPAREPDVTNDHVYRDENGNPTIGGRIGQIIAYAIMLGAFAYFWFCV